MMIQALKTITKHLLRYIGVVFVILISLPILLVDSLGNEIFSPSIRPIQHYHLDYLKHPERYGFSLKKYGCLDNKVPCLLLEPSPNAKLGKRGKLLRQQLISKGIVLEKQGIARGIVVLLHGRHGRKEDMLPVAERFIAAGFRCLIPDLPAHGESPLSGVTFGSSKFERTLPQKILADVQSKFQLPDEPAMLWGMSMGGAIAMAAASETKNWDALVVVSSFAQLDQILDRHLPKQLQVVKKPIHFLLNLSRYIKGQPATHTMTPKAWAKKVNIPSLIVHGESDYFIPLAQGRTLYQSLASHKKRWLTVANGGHNNVLATPMKLYAEMSAWMIQSLPSRHLALRGK